MYLIRESTMTTLRRTNAKRAGNLAATVVARALTNTLADSQGHDNGTVNVASTASTKSIFADKVGTSPVEATCRKIGLAATAAALTLTTLTTATAMRPQS